MSPCPIVHGAALPTLSPQYLSPDCRELPESTRDMIEVNLAEDPRYRVADDKLA